LILHYHATRRNDTSFWDRCRMMPIPANVRRKIDLWQAHGRLHRDDNELFAEVGWLQVLHGQGIAAGGYHPLADLLSETEAAGFLGQIAGVVKKCVDVMPSHKEFIAGVVKASSPRK
jgi:tryptophan halogenase